MYIYWDDSNGKNADRPSPEQKAKKNTRHAAPAAGRTATASGNPREWVSLTLHGLGRTGQLGLLPVSPSTGPLTGPNTKPEAESYGVGSV